MTDETIATPETFAAMLAGHRQPDPEQQEHQSDIEHSDQHYLADLFSGKHKAEQEAALVRAAHGAEPEISDGFDGGVRETAPPLEPPTMEQIERDHGQWLVDTFPHRDSVA